MKVRTLSTVSFGVVAVDEAGKKYPKMKSRYNGRDMEHEVYDKVDHPADVVIDVPDAIGAEMVAKGAAVSHVLLADDPMN